ncbi:rhamnogalacturonan lyase [Aquabacterium sp. OR-4]|uniref:rhamnogalacturonan lyase n=1 Tax=Aquabacterium sp. OR-4 TaxID=2978127 RepID=UPI0021B25972|nr:rhamnogalacturonan lyase [Aquabacterium sp. OR-4]MDT7838902.1 rhamnogalacturonan lyase [Aquabacterium sp. OR-4]
MRARPRLTRCLRLPAPASALAMLAAVAVFQGLAACALPGPAQPSVAAAGPLAAARAAVAVPTAEGGQLISWRWLPGDAERGTRFVLLRNGQPLHREPTAASQWLDAQPLPGARYSLRVLGGAGAAAPAAATVPDATVLALNGPLLRVPLQRPADWMAADGTPVPYEANDGAPADLDGDGQFEIVLKWQPANAKDNSQAGHTAPTLVDAYRLDGTRLWRIDLGPNIRSGAHYTPFVAADLDGDGRAELMLRTADATVDGRGRVLGDAAARHANARGLVLDGPEFMTVFDGLSGAVLASAPYLPARGRVADWGDDYGNRADRFLAGLAWLDGQRPSAVFSRGYYTRAVLAAWDWRDGALRQRWLFDSAADAASAPAAGQGAHWFSVADVDADGHDDIVYGAATIGHDGRLKYSTGLGHGDALHVGRLDPTRPGLQVFMVHESPRVYGEHAIEMHDAASGALLWSHPGDRKDIGRGLCLDIDPAHAGVECWASVGPLFNARGQVIGEQRPRMVNFGVWWDGDLLREPLDKTTIAKWQPAEARLLPLLEAGPLGAASNNGTKATPVFSADILGDWREEVVWRSADNQALLIASTPHPSAHRLPWLMSDRQYRAQVAAQNAGYNQPPHPSFDPAAVSVNPARLP